MLPPAWSHRPVRILDPDTPALLVGAASGPMVPEMTGLAAGSPTPAPTSAASAATRSFAAVYRSDLPGSSLAEQLAPFGLVVPGHLLVEALARAKGLGPDPPGASTR